ncbi:PREDICTED: uncharacterized protein LOC104780241 [Camelina sativa]|uniref:Uncharacterized protein LOC104780241 n=1 Tax=Camelina sativa TaxID=90675 RepID=A0ABM0YM11_CAMSA|nr:PREDICTED: uncharacterized protein LOC104780241 [Camelina sativa]
MRSLSFSLHRRRSRRRSPPPLMGKSKAKKKSPRGIPTGSATSVSSESKSPPTKSPQSGGTVPSQPNLIELPASSEMSANNCSPVPCKSPVLMVADAAIENPRSTNSGETTATEILSNHVPDLAVPVDIGANTANKSSLVTPSHPLAVTTTPQQTEEHPWKALVKGNNIQLEKKGSLYVLESGEACVTIPNSVIEKNKKAWDSFILGQFYEEPPHRGAVHAIVNGIWSRQRRDITVSKMEGHSFLFKVPCPNARRRILSQSLWQVDGQTMFVAKWSPDITPKKPELSMVPVWLDFHGVPLEFFNREGLEHIAGLVGHPVCLHPQTEKLTNIEVAKVYTVIDPRKPLPEAVNARFESGQIKRIRVSSPWLPALCSHCNSVGHTVSRCTKAPPTCTVCGSVKHNTDSCPRSKKNKRNGKLPIQSQLPIVDVSPATVPPVCSENISSRDEVWLLPKSAKQHVNCGNTSKGVVNTVDRPPLSASKPIPKSISSTTALPLDEGKLCVDLTANLFSHLSRNVEDGDTQASDSDQDSMSAEDDNPEAGSDRFLKVISKRMLKKKDTRARAGGPSIL